MTQAKGSSNKNKSNICIGNKVEEGVCSSGK